MKTTIALALLTSVAAIAIPTFAQAQTAPAASATAPTTAATQAAEDLGMRPDHHRPGHRFCIGGMGDPESLAKKVDNSMHANANGTVALAGCRAKPIDLLLAFREIDPTATNLKTLADLSAYIRRFVPAEVDRALTYRSACLREPFYKGYPDTVELGCGDRQLETAEKVYMNPDTKVHTMQSACANPGGALADDVKVTANDCIEVRYAVFKDKPIRVAFIGRHQLLSNKCGPTLYRNGDNVGTRQMPQECARVYDKIIDGQPVRVSCNWKDDEIAASKLLGYPATVQDLSLSYVPVADGVDRLVMPRAALDGETAPCYDKPDGVQVAVGVRKPHFVNGVATITAEFVRSAVYHR